MELLLLSALNGISFGAILFLLAAGLSLSLGLMRILNLSHGALYMIGAYVGWTLLIQCGLNFGLAVLGAGISVALLSLVLERGFMRHLYGRQNEQVLLTIGFIYILTNLSMWVWGPETRAPFTVPFLSGSFHILGWSYPIARLGIILIGLLLAIGLWWLQDKTRVGAMVRAGMDDREMTMALGINLELVSTAIFSLGAFVAGVAGIIGAQLLGAYLELSWDVLLLALVVVIVGGVGSMQGALLGGIVIGFIDAFGKALFPELAMFTIYLAMIVILLVKPTGLLGRVTQK